MQHLRIGHDAVKSAVTFREMRSIGSAAKVIGMDLGGLLKFKPWGATKLANGLNGALTVLGIALEAWDSWQQEERKRKFQAAMLRMQENLQMQRSEIVTLIDCEQFAEQFFPAFQQLRNQFQALQKEFNQISARNQQFEKWYSFGQAIDVEFREVGSQLLELPPGSGVMMPSIPSPQVSTRSNVSHADANSTASVLPEISLPHEVVKKKSFWQRIF